MAQKIQKKRFLAQHEFALLAHHIEHPKGESCTVPDESMSIRDILKKHVQGINVLDKLKRQGTYDENPDHDNEDLEKLAQADIYERAEALSYEIQKFNELKKKIDSQNRANPPKPVEAKPKGEAPEGGSSAADDDAPKPSTKA